ncbi:MAG: hypothetical protein GEU74_06890 [Nitriliruptorales bacterium]|nr:hypothetical protein [Nitriliruptorales bacterium]
MNSSTIRRAAAVFAAASIAVAGLALPAGAHALKGADKTERKAHARTHVETLRSAAAKTKAPKAATAKAKAAQKKADAAAKKAAAKARREAKKAAQAARYVATGTLVSVDGDTLTVEVTGGNRPDLRGGTHVFTLAGGARVNRDDILVALADLEPGDLVTVKGRRDGDTLWAAAVSASTPDPEGDSAEDTGDEVLVDPDPTLTAEGDHENSGDGQTDGDPSDVITP